MRLLLVSPQAEPSESRLLTEWGHEVLHVSGVEQAGFLLRGVEGVLVVGTGQAVAEDISRLSTHEVRPRPFLLALVPALAEKVPLEALLAAAVDDFLVAPYEPAQLQTRLEWLARRRWVGLQARRDGPASRGELERLSAIIQTQSDIALAGLERERLMTLIVERALRLCGASGASVALAEGDELVYRAAAGTTANHLGFRLKLAHSITGMSILRGEVLHTRDTESDPRVNVEATRATGIRSMIIVPLQRVGGTVGAINVVYAEPNAYDDLDVRTLELMGQLLGAALSNAAEFEARQTLVDELATTLTALQDSQEQRKQMQARLLLSDRLASLGTLAAGVAHEINNPLAFVLSNLGFLEEEYERLSDVLPREELRELEEVLRETRQGAERVRHIVRELQTLARDEGEQLTEVDVCAVLESSLALARHELRYRARVVKDLRPVPPVRASEGRLGQVFLNLLLNAAQALPSGEPERHEVRVRVRAQEGQVLIEVEDTGQGIPPEVRDRIFDPFFTTKPVGMGTGLGLSICHGIVTGLGGDISVESEVGRGSTFRVSLPIAPQ